MPDRYRTLTQILGPVNANASANFNLDIANNNVNVVKIKVTPTILGGSGIYQIYDRDTFAVGALVYGTHAIVGVYNDPITIDDAGNTVASDSVMLFLIPYYDRDETEELHVRIANQDVQAKSFEVAIVYEVPSIIVV